MFKTTREEREAEQKQHEGKTKYKIFSTRDKEQVVHDYFWADDVVEAKKMYDAWKSKNMPVEDVYFSEVYRVICCNDDGTESVYDSFSDRFKDTEEGYGLSDNDLADALERKKEKEAIIDDFKFFLEHYNTYSGHSHSRNEHWSLDDHILDDIEFNAPIIKKDKNGVPSEFIVMAKKVLGKDGTTIEQPTDEELKLAEKMFNDELDNLLHHVWLYRFFQSFGHADSCLDGTDSPEKAVWLKDQESKMPYIEGTLKEIDYKELDRLTTIEWKAIWAWMAEFGNMLWT